MAKAPVIIITGTPGTGKTTHAQILAEESSVPLKHINVGELVKEKSLYEEYDEEWQSYTVDEDKVCKSPFNLSLSFTVCSSSTNSNRLHQKVVLYWTGIHARFSLKDGQISSLCCDVTTPNSGIAWKNGTLF